MTATVDATELRLALRALTGGGDGEAALASALEASAGRGVLPRYKLPQLFAGLRRRAESALLALTLLVPTEDGTAFRVNPTTTPERIEAALAEQAREREARRATREAAAARRADSSPGAVAARLEAYRERKARNKAEQRARERQHLASQFAGLEGGPAARASAEAPVTAPVTAPQPVTSPPMSPATAGDTPPSVTAPVTDSHASARPAASDSPTLPEFKIPGKGEGIPACEAVTVTDPTPVTSPPPVQASTAPAPPAAPEVQGDGLEAQLEQVLAVWALAFVRHGFSEADASEAGKAAALLRLRAPGGLERVLLAVRRAGSSKSRFWNEPSKCGLQVICGKLFDDLVKEALEPPSPTSSRSPAPPSSSPLASGLPPLARTSLPAGWPEPPAKLPPTMSGDSFPGADKDEPLSWGGGMWVYNYNTRFWEFFGLDPNAKQRAG